MNEEQSTSNQPEQAVTDEEWSEWKQHPTTKTFRRFLKAEVERVKRNWLEGCFTSPESSATLQLNSRAIGTAAGYQGVLDMTAEDVNEGLSDE